MQQGVSPNEKTKSILGFTFQDSLFISWSRPRLK